MAARSWCFTEHNVETEYKEVDGVRYMVYQKERCPETGKEHLQGYVELHKPQRISWLKKHISGTAHWESRKGTRDEAKAYCMKTDTRVGEPVEIGKWNEKGQGQRTDLDAAAELIKKNPKKAMDNMVDEMPSLFIKYHRGIEKMADNLMYRETKVKFRKVETYVYWGEAGTGKTREVFENVNDLYILSKDADTLWFDGYNGEDAILIDDFYGNIKYDFLLRLLDGYPCRLPIKGGHKWAMWTRVFITSNKKPEEWYSFGLLPALERRLTEITYFPNI